MSFCRRGVGILSLALFVLIWAATVPASFAQSDEGRVIRPGNRPAAAQPPIKVLLQDPGSIGAATTTALFAHVAIGGINEKYTTVFTLLNTGSTPLDGNLILTSLDGTAMNIRLAVDAIQTTGSSVTIPTIPPGGTKFITATALNASDSTKTGWARVESSGGILGGVGTFQQFDAAGKLVAIAGVLAASVTNVATIPMDDNQAQNRYTGFAVANPSITDTLTIKGVIVDGDTGAAVMANTFTLTLPPGNQTAKFAFQLINGFPQQFRGSLVLIEQGGKSVSVVALVQNSGLFTAIPVIPSKAPGIN